jgi:ABC-type transporter MlaC component
MPNKVERNGMKKLLAILGMFLFLLLSLPVHAGVPMNTVQANVDKVLEVLRDPKLKAESAKETKKEKLCELDLEQPYSVQRYPGEKYPRAIA